MKNLKAYTLEELITELEKFGWEKYRAYQIFSWIWQKGISDINLMTNLSKEKRQVLQSKFYIGSLKVIDQKIASDGTTKFLFELEDGNCIESVFIPESTRKTVCVSSQVGCPLNCKICYTAQAGFKRNLKFYEIADQVLQIQNILGIRVTNVVFMGMGEPFLNYTEVLKAIYLLNSDYGLNIGARKITVSTAGIIPQIYDFSTFPLQVKLAISLNATTDKIRDILMPINKKYPLKELIKAVKHFVKQKNKRVTFEYVLIKEINDTDDDIKRLIKLLKDIPCKINVIPFNPYPKSPFEAPSIKETTAFVNKLYPKLPCVTIRKSKGADILAACGQLACKIV
ncbi:MAG: 23S rRNA (adenine(2503)-C(2))-methyltransferase RlmN [candidate division WOR-3 bacterium]|nr:23S rRNA (adenine(2503)-C(2))-methyltransferase RlmN [candidate division WOR-3 bacterium]